MLYIKPQKRTEGLTSRPKSRCSQY